MKKDGLTFEQERAAQLLALGRRVDDKTVAEQIGVTVNTIRGWKSDIKFKVRVMLLFEESLEYERLERARKIKRYLKPIYRQLEKKLSDPASVKGMPLRELLRIMTQLHAELRQDKITTRRASFGKDDALGEQPKDQLTETTSDPLAEARALYTAGRKEELNSKKVVSLFKEE